MKKIIAIIENQFTQFDYMRQELTKAGYRVFPEKEDYKEFVDSIRVFCDPRYDEKIRKKNAKKIFLGKLEELDVSLFLIDFKLAGTWDGMNGVQLALDIRGELVKFENTPVIFLSRTPSNNQEVKMDLRLIDNCKWVEKGYSGMSLKESSYFRLHVVEEIPKLISAKKEDDDISIGKRLHESELVYSLEESKRLKELIDGGILTSHQRKIIRQLEQLVTKGEGTDEIKKLLLLL